MRNLASLLAAPTMFFYMLTIFIYAHCVYDALILQVHDQMMIDMFLRPLPLLLLLLLGLSYMAAAAACQKNSEHIYAFLATFPLLYFANDEIVQLQNQPRI